MSLLDAAAPAALEVRPHPGEAPQLLAAEAAPEPVVAGEEAEVGDGANGRIAILGLGALVRGQLFWEPENDIIYLNTY